LLILLYRRSGERVIPNVATTVSDPYVVFTVVLRITVLVVSDAIVGTLAKFEDLASAEHTEPWAGASGDHGSGDLADSDS